MRNRPSSRSGSSSPATTRPTRSHSGLSNLYQSPCTSPTPGVKTPALPCELLVLIFNELRLARATRSEDDNPWVARTGLFIGWRELRKIGLVSKAWRQAADPLYKQELHIELTRELPLIAKRIRTEPARGDLLTRLYIKV